MEFAFCRNNFIRGVKGMHWRWRKKESVDQLLRASTMMFENWQERMEFKDDLCYAGASFQYERRILWERCMPLLSTLPLCRELHYYNPASDSVVHPFIDPIVSFDTSVKEQSSHGFITFSDLTTPRLGRSRAVSPHPHCL